MIKSLNNFLMQPRAALAVVACVLSSYGLLAVADGPVGEWALTAEFGGQTSESTLTVSKDGDELAGEIVSEQGELELEDVTFDDGVIEFVANIDAQGQEIKLTFSGKIDGNTLEGNWSSDFGEFPASGKRAGGKPNVVGTWKLMVDSQLGNNARELVIKPDMSGTYGGGDFDAFAISNLKVDGDTATMDVTLAVQGNELPSKITLKLAGDKVSGKLDYGQGEATITGERAKSASIVGTWKISADSQLGVNDRELVVNSDMTGTYGGGDFANFALSNVKMDGDTATMEVTISAQGTELPSTIKLKVVGDKVEGTLDFGAGTAKLTGTRE